MEGFHTKFNPDSDFRPLLIKRTFQCGEPIIMPHMSAIFSITYITGNEQSISIFHPRTVELELYYTSSN